MHEVSTRAVCGSYILVTACRNEAAYLEAMVDTVLSQTAPPLAWAIVDDGSTDGTGALATVLAANTPYVVIETAATDRSRSFASQVYAQQDGYARLAGLESDYIGFLDADIRLPVDYYESLMALMAREADIGLAGGALKDSDGVNLDDVRRGSEAYHVAGGIQFFRRDCFESIGGYRAVEGGGQDTVADIMVLMNGWRVRVFPSLSAVHLRPEGSTPASSMRIGLQLGQRAYLVGYHPIFYVAHCLRRLRRGPATAAWQCVGFLAACLRRPARPVTKQFVRFHRATQRARVKSFLLGVFRHGSA